MNHRLPIIAGLSALALLATAPVSLAQEPNKPPMHMHKSEMDHRPDRPDKEVSVEFKTEAEQLHAQAESHRKLAQLYKNRTPPKGAGSYAAVARHCENLAKKYEEAAKEAEAVAAELAK